MKSHIINIFPIPCRNFHTIYAKWSSILLQTIFQSTENGLYTWRHQFPKLCRAEHWIKRRCERFPEGVLRSHSSYKLFFSRKGSLPSDLFCTNVLRWTFYRTILHRDFTGKRTVRMKLFLTNLQLYWFSICYGEGLDKGFFMSYICRWKT